MKVYKVVRKDKGKLKSAMARREPLCTESGVTGIKPVANLIYHLDKTTKPKLGKIFAFDTEESALRFSAEWYGAVMEVYDAEAPDPQPALVIASDGFGALRRFRDFWAGKEVLTMVVPRGTVLCSELTLTRRVVPIDTTRCIHCKVSMRR